MDLNQTSEALRKNGFGARVFHTGREAADAAIALIGKRSVGIGGSWTIHTLGLYEQLCEQGNTVSWHWRDTDPEAARRRASVSEVYLASSNAVTLDGKLVNIDGTGNRVAAFCWGPEEVVLIAGRNKIARDTEDAIRRVHEEACGKNARRLGLKTPCATLDRCTDCDTPDRMCRVVQILERKPGGVRGLQVFLVDEDLGF
ncbi:MAG: LUD domain-containing protein [Clostridiaceae bacterium]|nr:LUD domain-containing protein [Clostridiaceae bacterium]